MGLVLEGTLNMPYPDDPSEMDLVTWLQAKSAMRSAWSEIDRLTEEVKHAYNRGYVDGNTSPNKR